jgi:hypothetical protein
MITNGVLTPIYSCLACHVYDPIYCKVMIIEIYDMQSKDMDVQCVMW